MVDYSNRNIAEISDLDYLQELFEEYERKNVSPSENKNSNQSDSFSQKE